MKKFFRMMSLVLVAGCLAFAACEKDPENGGNNPGTNPGDNSGGGTSSETSTIVKGTVKANGLDFNNDGTIDFAITTGYDANGMSIENGGVAFYETNPSGNIVTMSTGYPNEGWDQIKNLGVNAQVNGSSVFGSEGDGNLQPNQGNEQYVGFRIVLNGQKYYGWAKVTLTSGSDGFEYKATWNEIYYESTANATITTGKTK